MTPAPKSRVPKGRIVEEPPSLPNNSVDDHHPHSSLTRVQSTGSEPRRLSSGLIQPLGPRFTLRNAPDAPERLIVKRGTDEIREHLKHLGPSNLASRPRQTRYQNVKIKAPGTSPSRSGMTDSESARHSSELPRRPSEVISNGSGVGSKLLSTQSYNGKDGIQVIRQGYGTIDEVVQPPVPSNGNAGQSNGAISEGNTVIIPESQYDGDNDMPIPSPEITTPNRSKPNSVHSSLSRPSGLSRNNSYRHGPARSGSITEQVIDLNGIRKVILQTTSSSSSESDRPSSGSRGKSISRESWHLTSTTTYRQPQEHAIESEHEQGEGESASAAKKKRRRRKKKKHDDENPDLESAPLLPQ